MGDVSVTTGALGGADGSLAMCWKNTPCAADGGGACSGRDTAVLLTVARATDPDVGGPAGGAGMPGLGSGVSGPGANMAGCGEAARKTGAPAASDDKITGTAVSCAPPVGCGAITPGMPPAPAHQHNQ